MLPHSNKYSIRNWSKYNNALKQRGSLEIWIDPDIERKWYCRVSNKRGAPKVYSDYSITLVLQLRYLFKQALRQTEGFVKSVFKIKGIDLLIPDYTTICRRAEKLSVAIRHIKSGVEHIVVIVDSTGLKVFGEGEWKVKRHGAAKKRRWKKIHIGIDQTGKIMDVLTTNNDISDGEVINDLLESKQDIEMLVGDGGYDKKKVYEYCERNGIRKILIPPLKNAVFWDKREHGPPHPRDVNLKRIKEVGKETWKNESGYHIRSLVENTMFRYKTTFTDRMRSQKEDSQTVEVDIKCNILNRFLELGSPESVKIV